MKTKTQLERIAKSYDRHFIEYGKKDALSYDNLPDYITNDPEYPYWKNERESNWQDNRCIDLKDYLSPAKNMNFIHLGCSLSLKLKGYDKWPSTYYGVDISKETIQFLYEYIAENSLSIGSLYCGSVHETPFAESYFDIGDCIGVLEYYEKNFVLKAIQEFHRIMKPDGKFVLDIPNITSPSGRAMMLIEEYMGRPDRFDMPPQEFEDMIKDYFEIDDSDRIRNESHMGMVYFYCLRCKKQFKHKH
ncbi:MAG: class I SAM-dependent methyltransferase [Oscillospiraceae bacterium]|nr:class I SAM-dependent methyltransferase [Oscillospiraceae bacterium]